MMLWGLRSPSRYLLAFADGPVILYDSPGAAHLAAGLPTITEVRAAQGLDYIGSGGDIAAAATSTTIRSFAVWNSAICA